MVQHTAIGLLTSYNGWPIESCIRSIERRYFQWPWPCDTSCHYDRKRRVVSVRQLSFLYIMTTVMEH